MSNLLSFLHLLLPSASGRPWFKHDTTVHFRPQFAMPNVNNKQNKRGADILQHIFLSNIAHIRSTYDISFYVRDKPVTQVRILYTLNLLDVTSKTQIIVASIAVTCKHLIHHVPNSTHIRSRVQKFPAWHTKAAPNGKCCEGYIVPSVVRLTFWRRIFFQILAHTVFKMWVIQKPNEVALWNKRHFEEKKMEIIQHV